MKLTLRNLALGAALLATGAVTAQDAPTVTQRWIQHIPAEFVADVRCGNGLDGKAYVTAGVDLYALDGTTATKVFTSATGMNKGFAMDEAGNIVVAAFPTGANNWMNVQLIKASDWTSTTLELALPAETEFVGNRYDVVGRAVGDFFSEKGGVFYITGSTQTYPIPVWIANGAQVELSEPAHPAYVAANSMACAQPKATIDEMDEENVFYNYYYYTGSSIWDIGYTTEDFEPLYLPRVAEGQMPEGWAPQSQNGFDVFTLGDKTYAVRMSGAGTWDSNFLIHDMDGNVLFHTDYGEGWNKPAAGSTGNGCGVWARKVSDNKVELYQVFKCSVTENSFVALYDIELGGEPQPEQNVYMAGQFQGWDPKNPAEFTKGEDGLYTYEFTQTGGGFKISTAKGDWDAEGGFNSGVMGVEGNVLVTGNTYTLVPGLSSDLTIANGQYTLTVDLAALTLKVEGEEVFTAPELYVRGELNGWGYNDETKMTTDGVVNEEGNVIYTISLDKLQGQYKIASNDWSVSLGGSFSGAGTFDLERGGENNNLSADLAHATLTLVYPKDITKAPKLTVAGMAVAPRKAFAYDIKGEALENDQYKVTFKATEAAEEAEVVVKDAEGQTVATQSLTGVVKGENTITIDLADLAEGTYSWAVRLISLDNANERGAIAYEAPTAWQGGDNTTGGVVFIRDINEPAFGYVVVGNGRSRGFAVFDQLGQQVGTELYHVGEFNGSNSSSTTRGDALRGYAVFADWSDDYSGYWRIDPLNPAAPMVNMLMVEGATQAGDGTVTYNGVATGSGSCTVAFQGEGENTKMFAYDEDIYLNNVVRYDLGTADMITTAPSFVFESKGQFASQNVDVEGVENGFFVSQGRASMADANVPGIMYFDNEGSKIWSSAGNTELAPDIDSGFAVSPDGTLAAVARRANMEIYIYALSFDEYNEPTFTELYVIDQVPSNGNGASGWSQLTFDAGNNLHVFNRRNGGYKVYVLPGQLASTVAAKAEYAISKSSGVADITVDAAAPVQFFNLQGIEVSAENMTPGVYVRRQGNSVSKVYINK